MAVGWHRAGRRDPAHLWAPEAPDLGSGLPQLHESVVSGGRGLQPRIALLAERRLGAHALQRRRRRDVAGQRERRRRLQHGPAVQLLPAWLRRRSGELGDVVHGHPTVPRAGDHGHGRRQCDARRGALHGDPPAPRRLPGRRRRGPLGRRRVRLVPGRHGVARLRVHRGRRGALSLQRHRTQPPLGLAEPRRRRHLPRQSLGRQRLVGGELLAGF
mmetsp:Transcript_121689/g.349765  ORF Transcript_121689/g.349765 Transcript_121689/m.349765 type:complete len:215 (-) Transcript_121689:954-1598(-)